MKSTHSGLPYLHIDGAGTSTPSESVHQKDLSTSSHTNPGSPPPTPLLSPSSAIKPVKTLFDIDTDVFLSITTYLEIRDIIALRQVSTSWTMFEFRLEVFPLLKQPCRHARLCRGQPWTTQSGLL